MDFSFLFFDFTGPNTNYQLPPDTVTGRFSNFEVERNPIPTQATDIGPAKYGFVQSMGKQVKKKYPKFTFSISF